MSKWTLEKAKNQLSEVVRHALAGGITRPIACDTSRKYTCDGASSASALGASISWIAMWSAATVGHKTP